MYDELYSEVLETLEVCHKHLKTGTTSKTVNIEDALASVSATDPAAPVDACARNPSGRVRRGERDRQVREIISHLTDGGEVGASFKSGQVIDLAAEVGDVLSTADKSSYYSKLNTLAEDGELDKDGDTQGLYRVTSSFEGS